MNALIKRFDETSLSVHIKKLLVGQKGQNVTFLLKYAKTSAIKHFVANLLL